MAIIETGNSTAGLANVDAGNNLMVTTPQVNSTVGLVAANPVRVGAVRFFSENDSGSLTGSPLLNSPMTSLEDNLAVGLMTPLLDYSFNGTAQDTSMWYYAFTTMTAIQAGGFLTLNNGNIGTAATGCYLLSKSYYNLTGNAGLRCQTIGTVNMVPVANEVYYCGLGIPVSTTTPPTDGCWVMLTSGGVYGVVAYNGTVNSIGPMPVGQTSVLPVPGVNNIWTIRIHDRMVYFFVNDILLGSIPTPSGNASPFMSDALPVFIQQINTGTVSGSTFLQVKIAAINIDQLDSNQGRPFPHVQAKKGLMAYQGTQGGTMGSTALYSNSLAAAAGAAMTNTAVGPGTGLGGQFSWLPTLAAGTDGILCSYQVPAGGVNQTPRTLIITGVRIQSIVTTALTGGPVYELYSLAYGHTAASLATAETASFATASTKAPRRIALGLESFPVTAAMGQVSATNYPVVMQFISPVIVNPGEFVAIAAKNIGTVTTTGAILTLVTFDAYWE
jgi:hypothetical protein